MPSQHTRCGALGARPDSLLLQEIPATIWTSSALSTPTPVHLLLPASMGNLCHRLPCPPHPTPSEAQAPCLHSHTLGCLCVNVSFLPGKFHTSSLSRIAPTHTLIKQVQVLPRLGFPSHFSTLPLSHHVVMLLCFWSSSRGGGGGGA